MMRADFHEMDALARDLVAAPQVMQTMAIGSANRQADRMVKDAQFRIQGHPSAIHYPGSIRAEVVRSAAGTVSIELGVDKGAEQGPLWNILEFGTSKNGPIPHLNPAADAAEGPFATEIGVLAERAVR